MSFSVKSLDRTVFSQSAMKVSIKNQATRGQGSIAGPGLTHAALRCLKSTKGTFEREEEQNQVQGRNALEKFAYVLNEQKVLF